MFAVILIIVKIDLYSNFMTYRDIYMCMHNI